MSARGKNDSPWRNPGSLYPPGSQEALRIAPRRAMRPQPVFAPITEIPAALNPEAIAKAVQKERVVDEPRRCKNERCGARLTSWNKDASGLCFPCQRQEKKKRLAVVQGGKPPLVLVRCVACGTLLVDDGLSICQACLKERSERLKATQAIRSAA